MNSLQPPAIIRFGAVYLSNVQYFRRTTLFDNDGFHHIHQRSFQSSYDGVSSWINPSHLVRHTIQATTTFRSIPHHAYFPYKRRIFNVHMSASEATLHIISIDLKHLWPTRVMDTKSFHSLLLASRCSRELFISLAPVDKGVA